MEKKDRLEEYLYKKIGKKVTITFRGLFTLKIGINKFDYYFNNRKLIILDNKTKKVEIILDELNNYKLGDTDIILDFNVNESILLKDDS